MWSKFCNSGITVREVIIALILLAFDQENQIFFERWSWLKFNNSGLVLVTALKIYWSATEVLELKVRKFWGLIHTFQKHFYKPS